jgi:hypothetical protein
MRLLLAIYFKGNQDISFWQGRMRRAYKTELWKGLKWNIRERREGNNVTKWTKERRKEGKV